MKHKNPVMLQITMVLILLTGCADQEAFLKGKTLMEEGKTEPGLVQLKKASDEQPSNVEYKSYYYRQREIWVNGLLRRADNAKINQRWDEAEDNYKKVLATDSENQRAQDGLKELSAAKRHDALIQEAIESYNKDDLDSARDKVRLVLTEDPTYSPAKELGSKIEQKRISRSTPVAKLSAKFRKPVSLDFKDAPVKAVFEVLSKAAGVNFLLDKDLRSDLKVSVFVKNTTIEDALKNILSTNQLGKKILNENSVLIYPATKKADYEELIVRTFYLNSADPKQAMNLIKTMTKSKDVFVDDKLNVLVMRDTAENIGIAEKLIAAYDLSEPEVILEVEVLEITTSKLQQIGAQFPSQISIGVKGTPGAGQLTFADLNHTNSSMAILTITDPAFILNLQENDGSTNLLANPRIRVKNHKMAKILIGDRVPVFTTTSTATGIASDSVTYLDVGLKLDVEPSVLLNDEVSIDVSLEVSNIVNQVTSKNGTSAYQIGTRNANTLLQLKNGETQMLAGLINDQEQQSANRVPGLSSLPIIGRLFSNENNKHDKTEIVLLITPRIVRNIIPPDSSDVEFPSGTESGNSSAGMQSSSESAQSAPLVMVPPPIEIEAIPMGTTPENNAPPQRNPDIPPPLPLPPAPNNYP